MSKHTPGPWHWINSETDQPFDFDAPWDGEGRPSLRTVAEFQKHKNDRYTLPNWILDAEPMENGNDAANARLIAAAPDLLEAAASARNALSELLMTRDPVVYSDALRKLDAAIAKAEGQ